MHFSLIDPEKVVDRDDNELRSVISKLVEAGTSAILVGGSTGVSEYDVDRVVKIIEEFNVPSILFPGNVSGISKYADAILFMSLLNSEDPYFIIGAQVCAAPIIKRYGLEVLPTAYIIIGYGGAAGHIGHARPIPYEKPELVAAYALAAKYLGMKIVYLEAGSGAPRSVPDEAVVYTRKAIGNDMLIMVGGGIRDPETALRLIECGANVIVTGTILESDLEKGIDIIRSIKDICCKANPM